MRYGSPFRYTKGSSSRSSFLTMFFKMMSRIIPRLKYTFGHQNDERRDNPAGVHIRTRMLVESSTGTLGESTTWVLGESTTWVLGESTTWVLGESTTWVLGESTTWVLGESTTWVLGESTTWVLGESTTWVLGESTTWVLGESTTWVLGESTTWVLGESTTWVLGESTTWVLGESTTWVLGESTTWVLGESTTWVLGESTTWVLGESTTWVLGASSKYKARPCVTFCSKTQKGPYPLCGSCERYVKCSQGYVSLIIIGWFHVCNANVGRLNSLRRYAIVSSMSRSYREALGAERWNSTGGIPPSVKWRPLADKSCSSMAIWRIDHALVAPPGGKVTN